MFCFQLLFVCFILHIPPERLLEVQFCNLPSDISSFFQKSNYPHSFFFCFAIQKRDEFYFYYIHFLISSNTLYKMQQNKRVNGEKEIFLILHSLQLPSAEVTTATWLLRYGQYFCPLLSNIFKIIGQLTSFLFFKIVSHFSCYKISSLQIIWKVQRVRQSLVIPIMKVIFSL